MKRIKIILFFCIVFIISCRKMDNIPNLPSENKDIFSVSESSITNGQSINFNLNTDGIYIFTLYDSTNQQVLTREKITGKAGNNTKKIYTKSLEIKSLYLYLTNENNQEIGKTLIKIQ